MWWFWPPARCGRLTVRLDRQTVRCGRPTVRFWRPKTVGPPRRRLWQHIVPVLPPSGRTPKLVQITRSSVLIKFSRAASTYPNIWADYGWVGKLNLYKEIFSCNNFTVAAAPDCSCDTYAFQRRTALVILSVSTAPRDHTVVNKM